MSYAFHNIKHIIEAYLDDLAAHSRMRINNVNKGMFISLRRVLIIIFPLFLMLGSPIRGFPLHSLLRGGELVWSLVTLRWEEVLLLFLRVLFGNLVPHQIQGIIFRMLGIHPIKDGILRLRLVYLFWQR